MEQLICHLIGDYLLQSDWMATKKVERFYIAVIHGLFYSLPFLLLGINVYQFILIAGSHAVIDRLRVAKYICFWKNFLAPETEWPTWENCKATGYPESRPMWLTAWLMIIADNALHMTINYFVIG